METDFLVGNNHKTDLNTIACIDPKKLIGMRVINTKSHIIGIIERINNGFISIDYHGETTKYLYPSCFAGTLEIEDENIQDELKFRGASASFSAFKSTFQHAIHTEIDFLKVTGGKKYRIVDGERIPSKGGDYLYAFDTDTDMHFPEGTAVKLWFPDNIVLGYIVSCEDFTILIRTSEYIGDSIESVEFTSEQWQLLEALMERIGEMEPTKDSIAYEVATSGKKQIDLYKPELFTTMNQNDFSPSYV